jgi:uncharacterized membrane protein YcgQ (UPF0703/DUF1980 family)
MYAIQGQSINTEGETMYKKQFQKNCLMGVVTVLALTVLLFTISCTKAKENRVSDDDILEITEKMFIAQVNDVYLNSEDYLGKTIKLEGIFKCEQFYGDDESYCFVIRYGPGCCGTDGNAGFEVKWDKERLQPYPAVESWVEATGTLKMEEEDDYQYLYLDLSSLAVLSKRGAEVVLQ